MTRRAAVTGGHEGTDPCDHFHMRTRRGHPTYGASNALLAALLAIVDGAETIESPEEFVRGGESGTVTEKTVVWTRIVGSLKDLVPLVEAALDEGRWGRPKKRLTRSELLEALSELGDVEVDLQDDPYLHLTIASIARRHDQTRTAVVAEVDRLLVESDAAIPPRLPPGHPREPRLTARRAVRGIKASHYVVYDLLTELGFPNPPAPSAYSNQVRRALRRGAKERYDGTTAGMANNADKMSTLESKQAAARRRPVQPQPR